MKRKCALKENIKTIYVLVWGQCTAILCQKLEAIDNFGKIEESGDGIELLKAIKALTFNFQSQKCLPHFIHEVMRCFYTFSLGKMSTVSYLEQFLNLIEVISTIKGSVGMAPGLMKMVAKERKKTVKELTDDEKSEAQERYLAIAFIMGCDCGRFGKLIKEIENDFLQKGNNYPDTIAEAYNLLINYKQDPRNLVHSVGISNDGVSFTNIDGPAANNAASSNPEVTMNNNGTASKQKCTKDKSEYICCRSDQKGHYLSECDNERIVLCQPNSSGDGAYTTSSLTSTGSSRQSKQTGATILLADIAVGECDEDVTIGFDFLTQRQGETVPQSSGGLVVPDHWILLDNQSTVDVIQSAKLLRNICEANSFMDIHCNASVASTNLIGDLPRYGAIVCQSQRGLYYMSTSANGATMINTVNDIRSNYNHFDYSQAVLARKIQSLLGRPSTRQYKNIVDGNQLPNCPVTSCDINAAVDIFGPDVGNLKARQYGVGPENANFSYSNEAVQSGFCLTISIMDGQFEPLCGDTASLNIGLQMAGHDDHVPEVERYICTLKEQARVIYNMLPFQKLPASMIIEMIYYCNFWLNPFPHADGVSDTLSPCSIIKGQHINFNKHCHIEFGVYAQVHEDHDNSMAPRTVGAIALKPTGNQQGSYYFYNLKTGLLAGIVHA